MIEKRGGKYVLVARDGKVLGTHNTYAEAAAQEKAIQMAEKRRK